MTATASVSGRIYTKTRVRGLAPWNPRARTRQLLEATLRVLDEYAQHLPLALRQVFYRLVGVEVLAKEEREYKRLCEMCNRARRAGLIPWEHIRDDGAQVEEPPEFYDLADFWATVTSWASAYQLARQEGQAQRMEVWCEAGGMVPQLAQIALPHGVSVYSCGGFDHSTIKKQAADRMVKRDTPTVVLHLGDYDASGCAIVDSVAEDVTQMVRDLDRHAPPPEFVRLAVTPEQIAAHELPTAPPKSGDKRSGWRDDEGTVQLEALPPDVIAEILDAAIGDRIDSRLVEEIRRREQRHRRELSRELEGLASEG